ncbi:ribonuclease H-like protein, partial [Teratosphaeria nubilosa]
AAEDVSAAYAATDPGAIRRSDDDINGGLHSTHKIGKYLALDCEMVGTGPPLHDDHLLARASLVNFHGEQIYDSYVLPPPGQDIQDYRTHVSGITPTHIRPNYARPFAHVQKDVARLLEGRILVGHALRNDLQVLLLSHPKRDLRDTSRYAKYRIESRGKPPALRKLVKSELGLEIQTGEHSSIEDARASMMLFKKEKAGFEEENRRVFGQPR